MELISTVHTSSRRVLHFTCNKPHVKYPRFLITKPYVTSFRLRLSYCVHTPWQCNACCISAARVWDQSCATADVTPASQVAINPAVFVRPVAGCHSRPNEHCCTLVWCSQQLNTALTLHIAKIRSNSASPLSNDASHQCKGTFAVPSRVRHVFTSAGSSSCSFDLAGFHATKS